jgi:cytidine deaminase
MSELSPAELIEKAASVIHSRKIGDFTIGDVGCALLSEKGNLYLGVCIDVSSGMGFCAEHSAIAAMVTAGEFKIKKIVAVWKDQQQNTYVLSPCGRCREFMRQIDPGNLATEVILDYDKVLPLAELLPYHDWFHKTERPGGVVTAVSLSPAYTFSKPNQGSINLLAGLGVEGDVHMGATVRHRSRMKVNPELPNLRQVHLIHAELHDQLKAKGFNVSAGQMGENITIRGLDLLELPVGTRLHIGPDAVIAVTGLRDPCAQIDNFQKGVLKACLDKDEQGHIIRKAGVMSIVLAGGEVKAGDAIRVELPPEPHKLLEVV